jgi:hypothetical protein
MQMRYNYGDKRSAGAVRKHPPAWHSGMEPDMRAKSIPTLTTKQENRFWSKVDVPYQPSCCWEWTGSTSPKNYGYVVIGTQTFKSHRVAYRVLIGPIPGERDLDHLCRNPRCVNPDHLQPVTNAVNTRRGHGCCSRNRRKTHCKHGHEFTPENTYSPPHRPGGRECKTCKRQLHREYDKRRANRRLSTEAGAPQAGGE